MTNCLKTRPLITVCTVRKTDEESVPISWDRARAEVVRKCRHAKNESYCLTREKLLISGDIESNPGPVAHGTSTHTVLRSHSIALLQARLAQKGLKTLECTSDGSFFFSVAHQLHCIQ